MPNMLLKDLLEASCSRQGGKTAISFFRNGNVETEISYKDLEKDANRLANTLYSRGIRKGDRVIFFFPKSLFFVVAYFATQKLGAIAVPVNSDFKKAEMSYLLKDAEAKLILAGKNQKPIIEELNPDTQFAEIDTDIPYQDIEFFKSAAEKPPEINLSPEDTGLIIYTSGTTGDPKGVMLTNQNLAHDALNIIDTWKITESDVLCHALPLFHIHGLCFALNTVLIAGGKIFMLDAFDPGKVIDLLSKSESGENCNIFMGVPTMYGKLIQAAENKKLNFKHLRLLASGSAPLLQKDFYRIKEIFGKEPVEREGMSETGMNFSNPVSGKRIPGSIGKPLPQLEVKIVDPDTHVELRQGAEGEIWLRGPGISPGYWRKPKETAKAFKNGWFKTGDLGKYNEEGYYFLTDRLKHIIISGGENISPKEIENVINQNPGVKESSVIGIPDEKWGEKVVAAVVKQPGSDIKASEIEQACKQNLHKWKCPKKIVFVDELPKNTMGKILKEDVKKIFH